MDTIAVKQSERVFHDEWYSRHVEQFFPETLAEMLDQFRRVELTPFCEGALGRWGDAKREALEVAGDLRAKRVVDYGCGYGRLAMYLATRGAIVSAFDLSSIAISVARHHASLYGVQVDFQEMDAERLGYANDTADLVVGFGVLHHVVKYPAAGKELWRILKPGARAIFAETLWDNPVINFARRFTLEPEEAGDTALRERDIRHFLSAFSELELRKRHLLYMLKRLARLPKKRGEARPRPVWRAIRVMDKLVLSLPGLRRYCGEVIVCATK